MFELLHTGFSDFHILRSNQAFHRLCAMTMDMHTARCSGQPVCHNETNPVPTNGAANGSTYRSKTCSTVRFQKGNDNYSVGISEQASRCLYALRFFCKLLDKLSNHSKMLNAVPITSRRSQDAKSSPEWRWNSAGSGSPKKTSKGGLRNPGIRMIRG